MVRDLGPELTARLDPTYPRGQPDRRRDRLERRRPAAGRADRRGAALARPRHRGVGLQQLGRLRRALGDRDAADRRRPAPAPGHARPLVRDRGLGSTTGSSAAPRCRACRASTWARPTTSAWTITNVMSDIQDLFIERVDGDRYLFEDEWRPLETRTEEIVVKGRARAGRRWRSARPTTGRSSTRRSAPTTPSRWRCAWQTLREPTAFPAMVELLRRRAPARSWSPRSRATPRRPRTWSGPTATARSATS